MKASLVKLCGFFSSAMLIFLLNITAAKSVEVATVVGAGQNSISIVIASPVGDAEKSGQLQKNIKSNLSLIPFIKIINTSGIPGGASISGPKASDIDFKRFLMAGASLVITTDLSDSSNVAIRTFDTAQGKFLFGNNYTVGGGKDPLYDVADNYCADLMQSLIGDGSFFHSTMAIVKTDKKRKSDVWSVKPNGRFLKRLTNIAGEALSPTWSPDGRYILFTHIDYRSHALGVWDSGSGSVRRVRFPGNTVIGPSYLPDNRIAVSLTDGRNPSIFLLNRAFQKEKKLEDSFGIDVSPSIDKSGSKMAFTSDRLGSPQIFLKNLESGNTSRITTVGDYNTEPSISPDGTLIAFSRRTQGGHRVFVHDLISGQEKQISFGPGSDEEPAFAPDSFFIAYMSTRGGNRQIYLTTRNGGGPVLLPTGQRDSAFPAWGNPR